MRCYARSSTSLHRASSDPTPNNDDERFLKEEMRSQVHNTSKQPTQPIDVDDMEVLKKNKTSISTSAHILLVEDNVEGIR